MNVKTHTEPALTDNEIIIEQYEIVQHGFKKPTKSRRTLEPSPSDIERLEDLKAKREYKNMVVCKCPICSKEFSKKIFYVGKRLPAPFNCDACNNKDESYMPDVCRVCL